MSLTQDRFTLRELELRPEALRRPAQRGLVTAVLVAWRRWEQSEWTKLDGEVTEYLQIPYDAVTAPSYISKEDFEALDFSTEPTGEDLRLNNLVVQLSEHTGPLLIARTT